MKTHELCKKTEGFLKSSQISWIKNPNFYLAFGAILLVLINFAFNINKKIAQRSYISALEIKRKQLNPEIRGKSLTLIKDDMYIILQPEDIKAINKQIETKSLYQNKEVVVKLK